MLGLCHIRALRANGPDGVPLCFVEGAATILYGIIKGLGLPVTSRTPMKNLDRRNAPAK